MFTIKRFLNSLSFRSVSFLIICLCIGFLFSCSREVNGPQVNVSGSGIIKDDTLEWIFPEEAGWSSAELQEAHKFATQSGCQAVMALYDGKVFFPGVIFTKITRSTRSENHYERDKSLHPAYHFRMSARDMAKFGALYQKNGNWKGLQVIASEWIDESTMAYSTMENTNGLGYGYMWKIMPEDSEIGQMIGYPGYYQTGAGGHVLVIIPDLKLVIVERYDTQQDWDVPGAAGFELAMLILDARLSE